MSLQMVGQILCFNKFSNIVFEVNCLLPHFHLKCIFVTSFEAAKHKNFPGRKKIVLHFVCYFRHCGCTQRLTARMKFGCASEVTEKTEEVVPLEQDKSTCDFGPTTRLPSFTPGLTPRFKTF